MTNINRKIVHIIFWKRNAGMGLELGSVGVVGVWELGGKGTQGRRG